jgi:hypothetical protein
MGGKEDRMSGAILRLGRCPDQYCQKLFDLTEDDIQHCWGQGPIYHGMERLDVFYVQVIPNGTLTSDVMGEQAPIYPYEGPHRSLPLTPEQMNIDFSRPLRPLTDIEIFDKWLSGEETPPDPDYPSDVFHGYSDADIEFITKSYSIHEAEEIRQQYEDTCRHIDPPEKDCPWCGVKEPNGDLRRWENEGGHPNG